ncbi:aminotransferase class I/II-fold pyridoxal phosphate-dependent enzyme [Azonexus sp.]|jgi:UDP-4-amino-4-deoxy-L-arabinose-oxoglutarate aminotransferase|uniref:aminotransferase class I/II-fold pyridoxal phosphate-dependent enzyme n=1 Tax=Azonexus sp. TaxID=1872668 RepID=UPI002839D2C3|nr:aminotransferase class I/II-fold pyridoxal phosphate-dependent enzyme [Azonexus sp.]MDR1995374.1 UDP-4-amino-4-deoxy-L-arabinose aminotransferase [Azonexus sp.]
MSETFLPFCRPQISPDDIAAVTAVLNSGWITTGAKTAALEAAFCELTGARHAVAMASATAALHLYMLAKGIGPGAEVITPSLTWVSTINLITLLGAQPVYVDVDRDNLMATADAIERAITPRTKLIIPVHFAGAPLDLDPIRALAAARGIALLEDTAHALGTQYKSIPVGRGADSIFSLQAIKNVTAAEGGVLVTDDDELAAKLRRLRFHGLGVDAYDRATQGRNPQAEVIEPGFKYNLPDMCSALALSQLARLDRINARRAELAAHYHELLRDLPQVQPLIAPAWPHKHSWHLFVVRVPERDTFIEAMKAQGIGCGIHFRAVHQQKYYRELHAKSGAPLPLALPNTEWNSARICSLPLFPDMADTDAERVVHTMRTVLTTR